MAIGAAEFVALAGAVLVLGHGAGVALERARWTVRYPGLAVNVWLGLVAVPAAASLGLVALVFIGPMGAGHWVLHRLSDDWRPHPHPGGVWGLAFSVVVAAAAASVAVVAAVRFGRTLRRRRDHRWSLSLVAEDSASLDDVRVVDHPLPVAYCLPDRHRPIVLTSGALRHLQDAQLSAVLAHERAHLRHRHHVVTAAVDAVGPALSWIPTVRRAARALPGLLEMSADDAAAARCGRAVVASALRRMAVVETPVGALGASGLLRERLDRLDDPGPAASHRFARLLAHVTNAAALSGLCGIAAACAAAIPLPC